MRKLIATVAFAVTIKHVRGSLLIAMSIFMMAQHKTTSANEVEFTNVNLTLPENWYLGEVAGLEFLPSGEMVVFNRGEHPLLIFSATGQLSREIGVGLFTTPHGLFVDKNGDIWTTDQSTHQVIKFDQTGEVKLILGRRNSPGSGWYDNGYQLLLLNAPSDVALDSKGNIYVADGGNFRMVKFDPGGNFVKAWGEKGKETGHFNFPHSIHIDHKDTLYITDRQNARIQLFDTEGTFLSQWQDIGYPYEIEGYDQGSVMITDARTGTINKISYQGKLLERYGEWGKKQNQLGFPHGLAVDDKDGKVYVGELLNWRIKTFHLK